MGDKIAVGESSFQDSVGLKASRRRIIRHPAILHIVKVWKRASPSQPGFEVHRLGARCPLPLIGSPASSTSP